MLAYDTPPMCPYCGFGHTGTCHRVKAIEYYPDGSVKRVELHEPQPVILGSDISIAETFPNYDSE